MRARDVGASGGVPRAAEGAGTLRGCPGVDLGKMKNFVFEKFSDRIFSDFRIFRLRSWSGLGGLWSGLDDSVDALAC